jgi:4-hydroxy-2-oxoheptanedioate aldolase
MRLNRIIDKFEKGERVFATFASPDPAGAIAVRDAGYDALLFEAEHKPWDVPQLKDAMQYLVDRRQVFEADTLAPRTTPLVRIPPNGGERSQWHAKQALDLGAYGIVWPHVDTMEDARNAVAACRYPSINQDESREPFGLRGDSPAWASRYWGVPVDEYYKRADVWPLAPQGEILVGLMIESVRAVENLDEILEQVPGVGLILVGEGDLSQELGVARQFEHPTVQAHRNRVVEICNAKGVPVGHPHVTERNVDEVLEKGYQFLMTAPVVTYPGLVRGRNLADVANAPAAP